MDASLIEFANANYDISVYKPDCQFKYLGKHHIEVGTNTPNRSVSDCIGIQNWREQQKSIKHKQSKPKLVSTQINLNGEKFWNCNNEENKKEFAQNLNAALNEKKIISLLGDAGSGKSYYAKEVVRMNPNLKHLVISPYGNLILDTWNGYNAVTDCKALGMIVDKSGEVSQKTKPKFFNDIDLLIIDEAYLICLDHLFRLNTYIKRNKDLKVLILGDPLQNEAINKLSFGETMLKPYSEVIEEALTNVAPNCVRLQINKRMYKDQHHLLRIKKDLFRKNTALTTSQVIKYLVDENIIGGKIAEKDIRDLNIDKHLAYSNDYSVKLNHKIHRFQYKQQYGFDIWDGSYFVKRPFLHHSIGDIVHPVLDGNMIIVGDKSLTYDDAFKIWNKYEEKLTNPTIQQLLDFLCQERGVYILRKHHKDLIINSQIKMVWKPDRNKKDKYTFLNHEDKKIYVVQSFVNDSSIRYPYCRTGHSTQGSTIPNRYMIHMYESEKLCSPNWFWTCLTRASSLQHVYIHILPKPVTSDTTYRTIAETKLSMYKQTDEAKGHTNETYDIDKMVELLKSHHYTRCAGVLNCPCDNMMSVEKESNESMSFDRIINSMGHRISNLRVICLHCNRTAKDRDDKI